MKTALSRVIMMTFVILSLFAQVGGATTAKAAPNPPAPLAMAAVSEQVASDVVTPMAFSSTHCGVSSQFWVYDRHIVRSADGYEVEVWKRKVSTGTSVCVTMYKLTNFYNTSLYIKVNAVIYSGVGNSKSVPTLLKPGTSATLGFRHHLSPWYTIRVYAFDA